MHIERGQRIVGDRSLLRVQDKPNHLLGRGHRNEVAIHSVVRFITQPCFKYCACEADSFGTRITGRRLSTKVPKYRFGVKKRWLQASHGWA